MIPNTHHILIKLFISPVLTRSAFLDNAYILGYLKSVHRQGIRYVCLRYGPKIIKK